MGYATIVSAGEQGRYTIRMDWGDDVKTAVLEALSTLQSRIEINLAQANAALSAATTLEDEQMARYTAAVDAFAALHSTWAAGAPRPDDSAITFELRKLRLLQVQHYPLQVRVDALRFELAQTRKRIAYWNEFSATETRDAWCVDYTTDGAPSSTVATVDVPGESSLLLLAPGCRPPTAADGQLRAREMMSPEQVFFNSAILPGWQIDKPTYRRGTIAALDVAANTATVDLDEALSSAQRLDINRVTRLENVPVEYMVCNAYAFEVSDRCVVQFVGQSWDSPKVIGFVDNPRPCNWTCIGNSGPNVYHVGFMSRRASLFDQLLADTIDVQARWDGGAWTSIPEAGSPTGYSRSFLYTFIEGYDDGGDPVTGSVICFFVRADHASLAFLPEYDQFHGRISPTWPPNPSDPKRVVEFAVRLGGEVVLNVATTDVGWSGYPLEGVLYAKSTGGIDILPGMYDVLPLEGYTLLVEE